jgi:hypothetical protein
MFASAAKCLAVDVFFDLKIHEKAKRAREREQEREQEREKKVY